MNGYRSDNENTTPRSPTMEHKFFNETQNFKLRFDENSKRIIAGKNKIKQSKQAISCDYGVGVAEWNILSCPNRASRVCDVSLAPIYYRYGGTFADNKYNPQLDAYNLYTGDHVICSDK